MTAGQTNETVQVRARRLQCIFLTPHYQVRIGHCGDRPARSTSAGQPKSSIIMIDRHRPPPVLLCQHLRTLCSVALKKRPRTNEEGITHTSWQAETVLRKAQVSLNLYVPLLSETDTHFMISVILYVWYTTLILLPRVGAA